MAKKTTKSETDKKKRWNIGAILRKTLSLTGQELGIVSFAEAIRKHKNKTAKKPIKKPVITQEKFGLMQRQLYGYEKTVFKYYSEMLRQVLISLDRTILFQQQFFHCYYILMNALEKAVIADNREKVQLLYPLSVTQKEFDKLSADTIKYHRNKTQTWFDVFDRIIRLFVANYVSDPKSVPDSIAKILDSYKEIGTDSKDFLSDYCKRLKFGYFRLKDGRRSDAMERLDWAFECGKACAEYQAGSELRRQLFFDELPDIPNFDMEAFVSGAQGFTDDELIDSGLFNDGKSDVLSWIPYDQPKELSLFDVLFHSIGLSKVNDIFGSDRKDAIKIFYKNFTAFFDEIQSYLKGKLPALSFSLSDNPFDEITTVGALSKAGVIGYEGTITASRDTIVDYLKANKVKSHSDIRRIEKNGIAVVQDIFENQVNKNEEFIEAKDPFFDMDTRGAITQLDDSQSNYFNTVYTALNVSICRILTFNAVLEILDDVYLIDDITSMQFNFTDLKNKAESFNKTLLLFYASVYGDKDERTYKRQQIKKFFRLIDWDACYPPDSELENIRETYKTLSFSPMAFVEIQEFEDMLMSVPYNIFVEPD